MLSSFPDSNVISAIWALMDFHYLAQATVISSITCNRIAAALAEFHQCKQAIPDHGLHHSTTTKVPLDHFNIPKLELMHHVVPNISNVESILQWAADTTKHAHIKVIKDPPSMTNKMNYNAQICYFLDRDEKCCLFNTAIALSQESRCMEGGSDLGRKNWMM